VQLAALASVVATVEIEGDRAEHVVVAQQDVHSTRWMARQCDALRPVSFRSSRGDGVCSDWTWTVLLVDSLGVRTKTCIIATLSCASCAAEETLSTLGYAHRFVHDTRMLCVMLLLCARCRQRQGHDQLADAERDDESRAHVRVL
jgi:hypothetical protein